tara:strand:+ start:740 stop:1900 length:1161 start_codon:yes stop_codon:yes gene_type:complete
MAEKTNKVEETKEETVKKQDETVKVKLKNKKIDDVIKVDLTKPPKQDEEVKIEQPEKEEDIVVVNEEPKVEKDNVEEKPVIEEVTDNEEVENNEVVKEEETQEQPTYDLPEKLLKVQQFMNETGGDLNDYVQLNRDLSKLDDSEVLDEYFRSTKSHLSPEERNFILEERFSYDDETDDPKEIKKKKIALKEQVAEARAHLDRQKSKYYEDIKAGSRLTKEQQKAIDFFNRYNKDNEKQKKLSESSKRSFLNKTNNVFNDKFKGFDYSIGDKKFRFNVKDPSSVKETQSDINNFINKFVNDGSSTIDDVAGYHKSLFTAMNADTIAKHFYEQGKADAVKDQIAKDKNIDLNPRQTHNETNVGGLKVRALGQSTSDMKNRSFKIRKKN